MQLTLHADYAFRVLLYLGSQPTGHVASTREISKAYGISRHHLVRVAQTLAMHGYITISGGRTGGLALARDPHAIRLGDVLRKAETNLRVVECFDKQTNSCPIISACQLKPVLNLALNAFLSVMDDYTLADMLARNSGARLARIFSANAC
jgi:Rrf2 family transcriptional regulator, nitric oxide-sensitive transcriptional repressor